MAKKKRSRTSKKKSNISQKSQQSGVFNEFLNRHPNFVPIAVLFVLLLIFFNEVIFGGKTFLPPDAINSASHQPFVQDALKRGIYPLWNPYIFSGMPSFASLQSAPFVDLLGSVFKGIFWLVEWVISLPNFMRILINYFLLGAFTYILLMRKTGLRLVALFAALAMVFQPPVVAFTAFGHNTKIATAVFIPILFLLLDELLEKRRLHLFALFALAVGLQMLRAHTQIAYYTFMMMGLYLIFWIVDSKRKQETWSAIGKSVGTSVVGLVVGVAMSAWLYLPVQEYAQYSIRGGETGLDFGYATNWSFAPKEMLTFFVPSFFGFGGGTYWGEMPFTDFPQYMGVVTLFLAGIALIVKRDRYTVFFVILAGLALITAFGKHLPILYTPLFELLPYFNKFRVPSMILILVQFAVVVLAALGLYRLLDLKATSKDAIRKYVFIFAGACAVLALFLLLGESTYLGWVSGSGKRLGAQAQQAAYDAAAGDGLKMLLLVGAAAALVLIYLKESITGKALMWGMIALVIVDLWWVGFQITDPKPEANKETFFAKNDVVRLLEQDDELYRIYPVVDDKPANWYAYHKIQNILGYHAAKLKLYQNFLANSGLDARTRVGLPLFLDKYFNVVMSNGQPSLQPVASDQIPPQSRKADNAVLDMLNVKYLISYYPFQDPRYKPVLQGEPFVFENTEVLPRAYFVDQIRVMENDADFFRYLNSGEFDPAKEAVLAESPEFDVGPGAGNSVEVTSFDIHEITLKADVVQPALLVLSEIYYPAGWKAFVDGERTKIYRTNSIQRSIQLQPGEHNIRFVFESASFTLGVWITFGILFILLGLLGYSWWEFKKASGSVSTN